MVTKFGHIFDIFWTQDTGKMWPSWLSRISAPIILSIIDIFLPKFFFWYFIVQILIFSCKNFHIFLSKFSHLLVKIFIFSCQNFHIFWSKFLTFFCSQKCYQIFFSTKLCSSFATLTKTFFLKKTSGFLTFSWSNLFLQLLFIYFIRAKIFPFKCVKNGTLRKQKV